MLRFLFTFVVILPILVLLPIAGVHGEQSPYAAEVQVAFAFAKAKTTLDCGCTGPWDCTCPSGQCRCANCFTSEVKQAMDKAKNRQAIKKKQTSVKSTNSYTRYSNGQVYSAYYGNYAPSPVSYQTRTYNVAYPAYSYPAYSYPSRVYYPRSTYSYSPSYSPMMYGGGGFSGFSGGMMGGGGGAGC